MGFNPTFYAGRPKLSEVTIDSDLNMGGRDISGVDTLRASGSEVTIDSDLNMGGRNISGVDTLRADRVDSPYMPQAWPTETLDWGDVPEQTILTVDTDIDVAQTEIQVAAFTAPNKSVLWEMVFDTWTQYAGAALTITIKVNGTVFDTLTTPGASTLTHNKRYIIPANASVVVTTIGYAGYTGKIRVGSYIKRIGTVLEDTTFNLTGKWLALGINMQGLTATVKIQGVNMPYSDYAKYFPLAPSELTISGNWLPSQTRPIVGVYK